MMFLAPLIAALPGFLLKFVGGDLLQTTLKHFENRAASHNEGERIKAGTIRARLTNETTRRGQILEARSDKQKKMLELQLAELENPWTAWPKILICGSVAIYWTARFLVKTFGLDDFGVAVSHLSVEETAVSSAVLAYWFFDEQMKKRQRSK